MLTIPIASENSTPDASQFQQRVVLSGLVHDLRQPLSVIEVCADYLDLVLPGNEPGVRQQLELLRRQVEDANQLISDALHRLRTADPEAEP